MFIIRGTLNGSNPTPGEIEKLKNAKITSCDDERAFGEYDKNIQRSFIYDNFKHHIIVSRNTFE